MTPFLTVDVPDEAGTGRLAEDLAAIARAGDVVALEGDLGMGKSAFARAVIRALADDDGLEVPSPTFTLVQSYDLQRFPVAHFDLYRVGDPGELREIGFDDAIRGGLTLVEWPDRAGGALPADTLTVSIADGPGPDARMFAFSAAGGGWEARLRRSRAIRDLLDRSGWAGAHRRHLQGDASARRHERIRLGDRTAVMMDWPRRAPQPVLMDGLSYPDLVHVTDAPIAFAALSRTLAGHGFRTPAVLAADLDAGLILQDDLGSEGIAAGGEPIPERYLAAAEVLAEKDGERWDPEVEVPGAGTWSIPPFDRRAMMVELSLAPDWYVPHASGAPCPAADRAEFLELWAPLVERLQAAEQGLVLRDVHSPNLLWLGGDDRRRRVGLIDHQDAMIGPAVYDLMSLATDVRVPMPRDLRAALKDRYAAVRAEHGLFDRDAFEEAFALASAQRNTKILGGFARLARRDGKPAYLKHLPRVRALIGEALEHPVLSPLKLWYERHQLTA
jgi:tRNA threonylcarbamoyl adenosine modification protein YjeE